MSRRLQLNDTVGSATSSLARQGFARDQGADLLDHEVDADLVAAAILDEVIDGPLDRLPFPQATHVLNQQRSINGIGVIKVLPGALLQRQVREVFVVVVLLKYEDAFLRQGLDDPVGNRRFARAVPPQIPITSRRVFTFFPLGVSSIFLLFFRGPSRQTALRSRRGPPPAGQSAREMAMR